MQHVTIQIAENIRLPYVKL